MNHPVILFDGVCNLCNGFVQFIIKHDKKNKFRFGSLQSESAKKLLETFHFSLEELKTIVLVEDGKIYMRSRALLRIASHLDGVWKLTSIFHVIPSFISDVVYNLVSKYRYKVFGKRDSCMIPSPEIKSRFIE
jgi:predicted DCC family thiol-disulfide oxidoreductase YuxK